VRLYSKIAEYRIQLLNEIICLNDANKYGIIDFINFLHYPIRQIKVMDKRKQVLNCSQWQQSFIHFYSNQY